MNHQVVHTQCGPPLPDPAAVLVQVCAELDACGATYSLEGNRLYVCVPSERLREVEVVEHVPIVTEKVVYEDRERIVRIPYDVPVTQEHVVRAGGEGCGPLCKVA